MRVPGAPKPPPRAENRRTGFPELPCGRDGLGTASGRPCARSCPRRVPRRQRGSPAAAGAAGLTARSRERTGSPRPHEPRRCAPCSGTRPRPGSWGAAASPLGSQPLRAWGRGRWGRDGRPRATPTQLAGRTRAPHTRRWPRRPRRGGRAPPHPSRAARGRPRSVVLPSQQAGMAKCQSFLKMPQTLPRCDPRPALVWAAQGESGDGPALQSRRWQCQGAGRGLVLGPRMSARVCGRPCG